MMCWRILVQIIRGQQVQDNIHNLRYQTPSHAIFATMPPLAKDFIDAFVHHIHKYSCKTYATPYLGKLRHLGKFHPACMLIICVCA
jgi:hypothetical protein